MIFEYDFYYENEEGEKFTSDWFENLGEVREEMKTLEDDGYVITRTFKYVNGELKGGFA